MNNWLKINQMLNLQYLTQRLFKQNCLLCAAASSHSLSLCQACIASLPLAPSICCPQCGLETKGEICGSCIKETPFFDQTRALYTYAFPVDALLQHYKYNHALYLSETLGSLLSEMLLNLEVDIIIPMPLHSTRLKERGFNQSLEIAKAIAKHHNISIDSVSCQKIKNTPPQASLPLKERKRNMRGAFEITNIKHQATIKGKHVAIIDDVMTTGASLNELAKTLKKAGAKQVECWVIARTL